MSIVSPSPLLRLLLSLVLSASLTAVSGTASGEDGSRQTAKAQDTSEPTPARVAPRIHDGADPSRSLLLHARAGHFAVTWTPGIVPSAMEGVPAPSRRSLELPPALAEDLELGPSTLRLEWVEAAGAPRFNTDIFALPDGVQRDGVLPPAEELAAALRLLPDVQSASPLYTLDAAGRGPWRAATPRVLFQLQPESDGTSLGPLLDALGNPPLHPRGAAPNQWSFDLSAGSPFAPVDVAVWLHEHPATRWAQVDWIQQRSERFVPEDPRFPDQWHLDNQGQEGGVAGNDIKAVAAFEIELGDPDIVIAVMDSGVDLDHEDLAESVVPGWDFISGDDDPSPGGSSHGTSVAGTAGAPANGIGVVGSCPGCSLMPLRMLGTSDATEAEALDFAATNGADVINNSWGPTDGTGVETPIPAVMATAIDHAVEFGRDGLGAVVLWAAGNGHPADTCDLDGFVAYPSTIAVGSSTHAGSRASYSELCPQLDLSAPSSGNGAQLTTTKIDGYTSSFGGTSAAAPVASGVAALLLSHAPDLPWTGVRDVLRSTADPIDPGDANYDVSGHSLSYGYGRVDAEAALTSELSFLSVSPGNPKCSDELSVTLLAPEGEAASGEILAWSSISESSPEPFELAHQGDGLFVGVVPLHNGSESPVQPGDGEVGIRHDEVLTIEALDTGRLFSARLDCQAPVIDLVTLNESYSWGALFGWWTDEEATERIEWVSADGEDSGTNEGDGYLTEHLLWALDLVPCMEYRLTIEAEDRTGNLARWEDATTWVAPGDPTEVPTDAPEDADPCDPSTWEEEPPTTGDDDDGGDGCQCGFARETSPGERLAPMSFLCLLLMTMLSQRRRRSRPGGTRWSP